MKSMIQQFMEARMLEFKASGTVPCVAVVGHFDFDTLAGELSATFGISLDRQSRFSEEKLKRMEFEGVMIFSSASLEHGIFVGSPIN